MPPDDVPSSEVREAEQVFLLMSKDHRISRNIRAKWYLDHINTVLSYSDSDSDASKPRVISVLSNQSRVWNESSPPCRVTTNTVVNFLSTHHALVFAFDISPSTTCSGVSTHDVIVECMFEAFRNCVIGLTKPFRIPGSSWTLRPYLYVTVIAYSPLINCPVRQVLLHGYLVTCETVHNFLDLVYNELDRFENEVAGFVDKLLKESDEDPSDLHYSGGITFMSERINNVHLPADVAFFNLVKNAMLAIQLLPDNCNAGIIVVTDGVVGVPDVGRCDGLFTQLITQSCTCSFIEFSNSDLLRTGLGHIPHSELLKFFASATFGAYFSHTPDESKTSSDSMNVYHEGILCWNFQKSTEGFFCEKSRKKRAGFDVLSGKFSKDLRRTDCCSEQIPQWSLTTSLLSVVSSRLKDGFSIKSVAVDGPSGEATVTIVMVLPWKNDVHIKYTAKTGWPLDCRDKKPVMVDITYEGPYHFIHDLTCSGGIWSKMKSKAPTAIRKAVNVKFVRVLQSISAADRVLEQMQKFATEKTYSAIPENVRSGVSLFSLGSESKPNDYTPNIPSRDPNVIAFANFWQPLIDIDMKSNSDKQKPSDLSSYMMEKWFHIHRINLVLEHDMPLPSYLHHPSKTGKYSSIECRPAFTSLCSWFNNWSSFVLLSEQYYVKFISADCAESDMKPTADSRPSSFCFIRMIAKPPCVALRLNFLGGTSTKDRNKMIKELKDELSKLHFPKRGQIQTSDSKPVKHRTATVRSEATAYTSPSSSHEHKPPLQRDWSEVTCCVLLSKPVDRILVRYERVPGNLLTLDHIWSGASGNDGLSYPSLFLTSNHLARINSYLHHQRWVWGLHLDGFEALNFDVVSKILSIITKIRLQEGFHFAHSHAGMTSMILEVDMKNESSANADVELQAEASSSSLIQYVTFPPQRIHRASSNYSGSDSEDDAPSISDANWLLVTECWIEPQFGVVQNSAPERAHFDGCVFSELPQKIFPVDHGCITSLVTFEHLLRFCQRKAGSKICNGAECIRDRQPRDSPEHDEPRVKNVPFTFDAMSLLSKCQQVELLFCTYAAADPAAISQTENANEILLKTLIDELSRSSNEIELSEADCLTFVRHVLERRTDSVADRNGGSTAPNIASSSSAASAGQAEAVHRLLNFDLWAAAKAPPPPPGPQLSATPLAPDEASQPAPIRLRSAASTPVPQSGAATSAGRVHASSPYPLTADRADQSQYDTDTSAVLTSACTPPPAGCQQLLSPPRWRCFAKRVPSPVIVQPQPLAGGTPEKTGSSGSNAGRLSGAVECPSTAILTLIPQSYADLRKLLGPASGGSTDDPPTTTAANDSSLSAATLSSSAAGCTGVGSAAPPPPPASSAVPVMPVYVYYCSYSSLTERLVNRWGRGSGSGTDTIEDFRFVTEQPAPGSAAARGRFGGREWRTSMCSGASGDDDASAAASSRSGSHRRRSRTLSSGTWLVERSMSADSYGSGESELQVHCRRLRDLYYRSFILGLYQSLQQGYAMASCDVEAAITSICEEESVPVEVNLTEFLRTSCSHYQSHVRSAVSSRGAAAADPDAMNAVECAKAGAALSPALVATSTPTALFSNDNQRKIVTFDIFEEGAVPATDADLRGQVMIDVGGATEQQTDFSPGASSSLKANPACRQELPLFHQQPLSQLMTQPLQLRHPGPLPLSKLLSMAGPQATTATEPSSRLCNFDVKKKFSAMFDSWFRPIPSCPEYFYFCAPQVPSHSTNGSRHTASSNALHARAKMDSTADPEDNEVVGIVSGLNECSDTTESDELFDGVSHGKTFSHVASSAENRLTYMSISSSVASETVSSEEPPPGRKIRSTCANLQAPLFLQLVCSLRSDRRAQDAQAGQPSISFFEQLPVTSLPTCYCELQQCFYSQEDVSLSSLVVTLDMVCVKLPAEILEETDDFDEQTMVPKELTVAQLMNDEDEDEADNDVATVDSSFDSKAPSDGDNMVSLALPKAQRRALFQCKDEIEWLLADEMASARRHEPIITPDMLRAIVEHVQRSQGKQSCHSEKVSLDFVYGRELSFSHFVKGFEEITLQGYRLAKAGDFYYLVCSGHRMSSSSLVPSGAAISSDSPGILMSPGTTDGAAGKIAHMSFNVANIAATSEAAAAEGSTAGTEYQCYSAATSLPITIRPSNTAEQEVQWLTGSTETDMVSVARSLEDLPQRDRVSEWPRDTDETNGGVAGARPPIGSLPRSYSSLDVQQHISSHVDDELHVSTELRRIASTADRAPALGGINGNAADEETGIEIPSRKTRHVSEGDAIRKRTSFAHTIPSPAQTRELLARDPSAFLACSSRSRHTTGSVSRPRTPLSMGGAYPESISGYDADLSDDELNDGSVCSSGISRKSSRLPDFWLILQLANEHVAVTFHCSSVGPRVNTQESYYVRYTKLCSEMVDSIRRLCRRVNQYLLLQKLFDTRLSIDLLVSKDDDEIIRGDDTSTSSVVPSGSQKDSDSDDESDRAKQGYLEANLNLNPGHFECPCVGQMQFSIHPRLKASTKSTPVARATAAFMSVLGAFAVTNQRNMFVYREQSGNVFYLRLDESPAPGAFQCDAVVPRVEDEVFSSQMSGSRSSSVPSLYKLDRDESENASRMMSDTFDALSSSSRMTAMARRGEDCVVLKVFGICGPGPEIMKDLNQALVAKLHDRVLDELSMLLKKNPSCKLTSDDVAFIQKDRSPHEERTYAVPTLLSTYIVPLMHALRQNMRQPTLCFHPKYADQRSETHFKDFTQATAPEMCEEDTFIYNKPKETQASDKGSGIALVYVKLLDSYGNVIKPPLYSRLEADPEAYSRLLESSSFEALTSVTDLGRSLQPHAAVTPRSLEAASKVGLRLPSPLSTQYYIRFSVWLLLPDADVLIHEQRGHIVRSMKCALRDTVTQYFLLTAAPLCGATQRDDARGRDEPVTPCHFAEEPKTPTKHSSLFRTESLQDDMYDVSSQKRSQDIGAASRSSRRSSAFSLSDVPRGNATSPPGREVSLPSTPYATAFDDGLDDSKSLHVMADDALPLSFVDTLIKWLDYCAANNLVTEGQAMYRVVCGSLPSFLARPVLCELHDVFARQLTPSATVKAFCFDGSRYVQHDPSSGHTSASLPTGSQPPPPPAAAEGALGGSTESYHVPSHLPSHLLLVYSCGSCSQRTSVDGHGQTGSAASSDVALKGSKSSARIATPYSGSYPAADPNLAAAAAAAGASSPSTSYSPPRQQLITVFVRHRQVQMYICNWTDEHRSKHITSVVQRVIQWSNDRQHVLDCVALHKAGLFHLSSFGTTAAAAAATAVVTAPLATASLGAATSAFSLVAKDPALTLSASSSVLGRLPAVTSKDELRISDIEKLVNNVRYPIADQTASLGIVSAPRILQPQLQSVPGTAGAAMTVVVPTAVRQQPQAPREVVLDHQLTAACLDTVYRNCEKCIDSLESFVSPSGHDLLQLHGSQLRSLYDATNKERERKERLYKLHQELQRGSNSIPDILLGMIKEASRVVHIVATPLLFSPHWRKKAMAQLVHCGKDAPTVAAAAPQRVPAADTCSGGSGQRSRHSSGASGKLPAGASNRGDSPLTRSGVASGTPGLPAGSSAGSGPSARSFEEEHWHVELRQHFVNKYIEYMRQPHNSRENHGFSVLTVTTGSQHSSKMAKPISRQNVSAVGKDGSGQPASASGAEGTLVRSEVRYLQKPLTSGTLLLELSFEDFFFCVKLYVCNASHFSGSKDTRDAMPMFIDTCDRIRDHTHCHSFAHDFHLRMVLKHVRGQGHFNSSYHLTNFLQDFRRFHAWAPRYARSLLKIGSVEISNTGNIPYQLYDYIVNNKDDYDLKTLNMVESDNSGQTCERALAYEYVLPPSAVDLTGQLLKQKPGELEVAVVISHDIEGSLNLDMPADTLLLKFYVVLINKTQQFPFRQRYAAELEAGIASDSAAKMMTVQELTRAELTEKLNVGSGPSSAAYSASPAMGWLSSYATAAEKHGTQIACLRGAPEAAAAAGSLGGGSSLMGQQQRPYYELLDHQAAHAKDKIKEIVRGASTGCRRDSFWSMLRSEPTTAMSIAAGLADDEQLQQHIRKRRDMSGSRENLVPKLSVVDFQELLRLVKRVPINAFDERLQTFANMPTNWYSGLNQALMRKYPDYIRQFQKDGLHYVVILVPKCEDVAALIEIQPCTDVSLLFRVPLGRIVTHHREADVLALPEEVSLFLEDFVSTMCFHMWQNMITSA